MARALRMAAQGCHHAKNALGAFYRRIQARAGGSKAIVATARKIAERVYRLLKYGQEYVRQSEQANEAAYQERVTQALARRAASLGYQTTLVRDAHSTWDSRTLSAAQIIAHHNDTLKGWFVTPKPASEIEF